MQCKNQHLANVLLLLPWNQRSSGDDYDAWQLEKRMRIQKVTKKGSGWERINVCIVKRKDIGPKSDPQKATRGNTKVLSLWDVNSD